MDGIVIPCHSLLVIVERCLYWSLLTLDDIGMSYHSLLVSICYDFLKNAPNNFW